MSGAQRNRAYRERLKAGRSIFAVEVDHVELVEALTRSGFLPADREPDHDEIGTALQKVVTLWIEDET